MKLRGITSFLLLIIFTLACGGTNVPAAATPVCSATSPTVKVEAGARPFHMGFTRWPSEATIEGIQHMNEFLETHGDLTAMHYDGGIPWPEALTDGEYPEAVMSEWQWAKDSMPANHKLYVAITPLDNSRTALAEYWGTDTGQPLPKPWDEYPLNHPDVKTAYLNFARRAIEFFQPDYFAIGVEVNVAQAGAPETWTGYKELHQYVYENLKRDYPDLPIFATFTNTHMNGLDGGNREEQKREITELLKYSDLLGLSAYPYGWPYGNKVAITEDFFDTAISFGKPIVISESGMSSAGFEAFGAKYDFTQADQTRWIQFMLEKAAENNFGFVVNFASTDYNKLMEVIPPGEARELATFWLYTGLERSDRCAKESLGVWDAYLKLPFGK
jgi:hypothetical protein